MKRLLLTLLALALAAPAQAERSRRGDAPPPAPRQLDPARPLDALQLGADEAAARAGSFAWEGTVTWSVAKAGGPPVRASERHRVRQLATGEFEASSEIDPGTSPGAETGKQVVYAGGMTYAHGRWSPFRERPTDRGRDARRFRDESFRLAADLAALYGPALAAQPAGEVSVHGRRARRYVLSLSGAAPEPVAAPAGLPDGKYDADTQRRVDFLEGRVPAALSGELLLDAATGLPLTVTMRGAFSQRSDPQLRAEYELVAQVRALGGDVPAVNPPKNALADERKPKGVARALEAAGLRHREGGKAAEAADDEDAADE